MKLCHGNTWTNTLQKQPIKVFYKKGVLRNFAKFTWKHLYQSLFFDKVAGPWPATLLKKRLWCRCFPLNFAKFLRAHFLYNTSVGLLLTLNYLHRKCCKTSFIYCFILTTKNLIWPVLFLFFCSWWLAEEYLFAVLWNVAYTAITNFYCVFTNNLV